MNSRYAYKSGKAPDQDIETVFTELYRLKPIINSDDEYHKNYIVIRLVTIIEQFMRATIEDKLYTNSDQIPTQILLNPLVIDEISNRSPMKKKITKELIVSASLLFQNTKSISDELKRHKIMIFYDDIKTSKRNNVCLKRGDYDKLFNLRHELVHTLNRPSRLEVKQFFILTEKFIRHILDNNDKDFFDYMKIIALVDLNQYDEALKCFNKIEQRLDTIIDSQPSDIEAYFSKAVMLVELEKHEDAISCFNKIISLQPTNARVYALKGQSLHELGKDEDAIACFDKAMDLGKNDVSIYIMKGNSLLNLNKNKLAIECFDAALCLYPDNPIIYYGLGKSLQHFAHNEEAIKCLKKALQLGFDNFAVYFRLGSLLYKSKQYTEAVKYLRQALLLNPDAHTHYWLGMSLQKLGKDEESIIHIKQASQLDPSNYPLSKL